MSSSIPFAPKPILGAFVLLSILAITASLSGVLLTAPAPMMPALIWLPVLLSIAAYLSSSRARRYFLSVPMIWLFVVQAIRAPVGVFFLVQGARGTLPMSLAATAGWGDLLYGIASIFMLLLWTRKSQSKFLSRPVVLAWNLIGLVEILAVIVAAMRFIVFADKDQGVRAVMTAFPTVLIPMVLVPAVLLAHFKVFIPPYKE